ASKLAFIYLTQKLEKENYKLIDCQVYNNHLASLGASEISRDNFLNFLTSN
ncbi:MAG: leucyl/phenylalanyl-tRNA--protein transferase, partial [Lutibacter sp.]